jgi:hypothetical protein
VTQGLNLRPAEESHIVALTPDGLRRLRRWASGITVVVLAEVRVGHRQLAAVLTRRLHAGRLSRGAGRARPRPVVRPQASRRVAPTEGPSIAAGPGAAGSRAAGEGTPAAR